MKNKKLTHSEILDVFLRIEKYFNNNAISVLEKKNNKTTKEFITLITQNID